MDTLQPDLTEINERAIEMAQMQEDANAKVARDKGETY